MKTQNKALALVLTLVLAFVMTASLAVTAFAETDGYTITINNTATGHTYEAYQIFAGDLSTDEDGNNVLSNVTWGKGVTPDEDGKVAGHTAEEWLATLTDEANAKAFAEAVAKHLSNEKTESVEGSGSYTISGLDAGYYLVKDKDESLNGANDTYTGFILKVVDDATATPKGDKPKVEKKVKDINDSTETETSDWQDSADHDIGDTVEFQLTGTLPSNYDDYKSYKYVFHDTMSKGLTYKEVTKIAAVNGEEEIDLTEYFTVTPVNGDDGTTTLTITCNDLKAVEEITKDHKIVVEYTAELNSEAEIGAKGNPNEVYLEFSNNPNYDGDGEDSPTGNTLKDKVIVFTYELDDTKTDGATGNPLDGAGFTLYKWYADKNNLPEGAETATDDPEAKDDKGAWVKVGTVVTDTTGKINFKGLDDGEYVLVETTVPEGYNKAANIEFTITAEHDEEADEPTLTKLEVKGPEWNASKDTGKITGTIENNKGTTLPETGGIGTTIFYIIGGLLVVSAGVLLITKHRMSSKG